MPFRWQGPPPMMGGEGELTQLKIYHYRIEEQQFHQVSSKDSHDRENSCAIMKSFLVFFSACIMIDFQVSMCILNQLSSWARHVTI